MDKSYREITVEHENLSLRAQLKEALTQLSQAQARIQELEGLVREMGEKFENVRVYTFSDPEGNELKSILSRPQVRAIMEDK